MIVIFFCQEEVDPFAGDGRREVQWMKLYSGSQLHKEQANTSERQERENTKDDSTNPLVQTKLNDRMRCRWSEVEGTLGTGLG